MKHNNWFWGIIFVLAAVIVIASQVTSFAHISFTSILVAVALTAMFIQSLVKLNYFGIFLSLALAYWIFQVPLHLFILSPWLLIIAAILVSIGFQIIFQTQAKYKYQKKYENAEYHTVENIDDNNPEIRVSFGASSKYLHADALKGGQFYCRCGALEVYFDQVQLDPNGAEIYVDCSLGSVELYFPRTWRVIDKLHGSLSSIENVTHRASPNPDAPQITVTGNVSLGSLEIKYV